MGIGKFILTSLVSAVAMLALAVVWYFGLAASFYAEHMAVVREIRLYDVIALAYLVLGAMMALMYPAGYAGGHPAVEGARFGAMIGIIFSLPHSLLVYAMQSTRSTTLVLADTIWHVVEQGVGGMVIGLLYGRALRLRAGGDSAADGAMDMALDSDDE